MPVIHVEFIEGRTLEQKRALAEAFADAACKIINVKRPDVYVIFSDLKKDSYFMQGSMVCDKVKEQ